MGSDAHKWDEVVNHDRFEKVVLSVHKCRRFKAFSQDDSSGELEEVSLLCSKIHWCPVKIAEI